MFFWPSKMTMKNRTESIWEDGANRSGRFCLAPRFSIAENRDFAQD